MQWQQQQQQKQQGTREGRKEEGHPAQGCPLFFFLCFFVCLLPFFLGSGDQRAGALAGAKTQEEEGQSVVACLPCPAALYTYRLTFLGERKRKRKKRLP
jgi:hypothetical protein